jgi:hypothetical protein
VDDDGFLEAGLGPNERVGISGDGLPGEMMKDENSDGALAIDSSAFSSSSSIDQGGSGCLVENS